MEFNQEIKKTLASRMNQTEGIISGLKDKIKDLDQTSKKHEKIFLKNERDSQEVQNTVKEKQNKTKTSNKRHR